MDVYLELGAKRFFASVVDWPGWARSGPDEEQALAKLYEYAERYRKAVRPAADGLSVPKSAGEFKIIERLQGNATTDFGAPGVIPKADEEPTGTADLDRLLSLLKAAWAAFDRVADAADGVELGPSGPRGGGRSLNKIRAHVAEAQGGYLGAVGGKVTAAAANWPAIQDAFVAAVAARSRGELPEIGPRGGKRWPARFAIRRSAWHALDHAWEIEDRQGV